jgi:hypothetical protein
LLLAPCLCASVWRFPAPVGLEPRQQLAQQTVECPAVGAAERLEQSPFGGLVRFNRAVDGGAAFARQAHEGPAAIVGIWAAFDQAGLCQPVEPLGDPAGGEHGRVHQIGWIELVGRTGSAQRREQVEPTGLQAVGGGSLRELAVGEVDDAEQPGEERERGRVQIGALAVPLRHDPIDVVKFTFRQDSF